MNLTPDTIRSVDAIADPLGVLSLYADGPGRDRRSRPAERVAALHRRLLRVEAGLREAGAVVVADRYRRWLPRIESQLMRIAHAASPAAAAFVPLSTGRPIELELPMPVGDHARVEPTGHVMPLVAAHDEGRAAGVAVARRSAVEVFEWRQGRIEAALELPVPVRARGSLRHDLGRGYRIDAVGEGLRRLVEERGWRRLVVSGDPRLRSAVACGGALLQDVEVRTASSALDGLGPEELADRVAADLDAAQRVYECRLVERTLDAALYDQSAVIGIEAVGAALDRGLVEHLVIDPSRVRSQAAPPRTGEAERLVELALATGAEITPLEGTGAPLAGAGGVAALLR